MRVCLFLVVFLLAIGQAAAQTGVIWGTVTDAVTGERLPSAGVFLADHQRGAATDIDGMYRIEGVPLGRQFVTASFTGYHHTRVDTVLVDSLRLDFALHYDCLFGPSEVSVVVFPRGTVYDTRSDRVQHVAFEPLAGRVGRAVAWDRGADALGRWRPAMRGAGRTQAYVDGLPALTLDAVPLNASVQTKAHVGYVPAAYGGSAAGAVVTDISGPEVYSAWVNGLRPHSAGGSATGPVVRAAASTVRTRRDSLRCNALIERVTLDGEAVAFGGPASTRAEGRALAEYVHAPGNIEAYTRAGGASSPEGNAGSAAFSVAVGRGWRARRSFTAGVEQTWGDLGTATLVSARLNAPMSRYWNDTDFGAEASVLSRRESSGAGTRGTMSAVAAYAERRYDWGADWLLDYHNLVLTVGARGERFGGTGGGAWTLQPRALLELDLNGRAPVSLYGVRLSAPGPGGDLIHRTEGGIGIVPLGGPRRSPLTVRLSGYARSLDGPISGEVVGLDAEVSTQGDFGQGEVRYDVRVRRRTERGDPLLVRDRTTASLWLDVREHGPGRMLGGRQSVYVDVSQGIDRQRVIELGGEWEPYWLGAIGRWLGVQRSLSVYGRGVVAGRDAVPCVGGLVEVACPAPTAEIALRIGG